MKNFKQLFVENNDSTLINITGKAEKKGVKLFLYLNNSGKIVIDTIVVPKDMQNLGIGTNIMEEIIEYADKSNKYILVSPGDRGDMGGVVTSKNKLIKFYKSFGFVLNKGRNKDYTISQLMYRKPE